MQVRCLHCHDPIELDDAAGLDSVSCPTCGESFKLVGDDTLPLPPETAGLQRITARKLGRFELLEQLGKGGYGTVWLARDPELDRLVAVKVPRTSFLSADETEQFLREARAAAQLHHPNIVTVHEIGRDGDTVFIVSDYVRGQTLSQRLTAQRMSAREAAQMTAKIAEALDHAHEHGVIHRDLKPGNIMVAQSLSPALPEGNDSPARAAASGLPEPCIMDFGLARREAGEMTMTVEGQVLGTPYYMSPEQARGESHQADRRSDIYSLGVILYAMLTGELPFRGNVSMLVHQILNDEPSSLRRLDNHVPRDLETICLKCLHKNPDRRYQRASELATDLRRWLHHEPIHARPVGRLERAWRWSRRKPWAAAALGILFGSFVVISVVLILLAVFYGQRGEALRASYLASAQLLRNTVEPQRRWRAIELLESAAAIRPGLDLRNEYLRCLELADIRMVRVMRIKDWRPELGDFATLIGTHENVFVAPHNTTPHEVEVSTGRIVRTYERVGPFSGPVSVSPDGKYVAADTADGRSLQVWQLASARLLLEIPHAPELRSLTMAATFSNDSSLMAVALGTTKRNRIAMTLYQVPSFRVLYNWEVEGKYSDCMRFGPNGRLLAASLLSSRSHMVKVWSCPDGTLLATMTLPASSRGTGNLQFHRRLDFSRDGRRLVAASGGGTITAWNIALLLVDHPSPPTELFSTIAHEDGTLAAQFSPDAHWLASAGSDGTLKVWSLEPLKLVAQAQLGQPPVNMDWSASGSQLLCDTTNGIAWWDFAHPAVKMILPETRSDAGRILALEFDSREDWLASSHQNLGAPTLIDLRHALGAQKLGETNDKEGPLALAFAPDSQWLSGISRTGVQQWSLRTGQLQDAQSSEGLRLLDVGVDVGGDPIVVGLLNEQEILVRNHMSRDILFRRDLSDMCNRIEYLPGAFRLVLLEQDVALSPAGRYLSVIARLNGQLRLHVFDLQRGREVLNLESPTRIAASAICDESNLVAFAAGSQIYVYDLSQAQLVQQFQVHQTQLADLAFGGRGDQIAALSAGSTTITLLSPAQAEPLAELVVTPKNITRVALSATNRWLAAGDTNGGVWLWDLHKLRTKLRQAGLDWSSRPVR